MAELVYRPPNTERIAAWKRQREVFQERSLASIGSGKLSTRYGVKPCGLCSRTWECFLCGRPFKCWITYPFLWDLMPRRLRNEKLCRTCYGDELVKALERRGYT